MERVIRDRDIEIDRLKKEYRVGLEREIIELEGLVENLEGVVDELESTSQVQDRVQVEVRDSGEVDKDIKDAINKNEVAQLGLSPLQSTVKGICEIDCEIDIYIISGYDRLINKLRAKFVNSKGINGIIREIKGVLERECK